jgi:membrane-bound lytic murein transglycosylase MltF
VNAKTQVRVVVFVAGVVTLTACGDRQAAPATQASSSVPPAPAPAIEAPGPAAQAPAAAAQAPASKPVEETEAPLPPSELETQLPETVRAALLKPFTGDFDGMIKRRLIRIGVTFNRTFYFVDKGVQRGVAYEYGRLVEERLNKALKTGNNNKVLVFFVPLTREKLLPALVEGKVDMVAAQITVRPELQKFVDFTNPTRMNVNQIVVTGPGAPPLASVEDLSGRRMFVRKLSAYHQSLLALNDKFTASGKPPVTIEAAPENLEDDDLLEMVNAGLIPAIVVDNYLATFWKKVFPNLTVHENVAVRTGGTLAIAIRKNSPNLSAALNKFMAQNGLGTAFGNTIERRYLVNTTYVKSAASDAERRKFLAIVELFRKYSDKYNLDFLLMAAQGYQESQLNHGAKSHVGAIGIMQLMPATGKEMNVGDIKQVEANVHAGVKYMRVTQDAFFKDQPMDDLNRGLFTFAAYNAGPGRIRQLRNEAAKRGLDPNVWFGNVEQIASERIGRETVTYVANIYKYYIAYRLVVEETERRATARAGVKGKDVK